MSIRPTCALALLCVVQGCERFAFLAMLPLFVLYLHHRHGFSEPSAMLLLGVMSALSYVGGLPAGILADRQLGPLGSLLLGGALLMLGYGALALDHQSLLWPALAAMTVGHSLFKPSISTLFGSIFDVADVRREHGFLWQHLAVNLAGMMGPLCGEWLRVGNHWERLFLSSVVVMFICCAVLVVFARLLPKQRRQRMETDSVGGSVRMNRERWIAVCWLCGLSIVFWLTAQQAGGSLAVFAESHTQRRVVLFARTVPVGPGHFAALHGLQVLLLLPLLMTGMSWLRRRSKEPSALAKMVWGYVATAGGFVVLVIAGLQGGDAGRVSPAWLTGCYLLLSLAELLLSPLGLSLVTRIAPPHRTAQAVGMWFAAAAVGNTIAGIIGLAWGRWPHHRYFAFLALLSVGAAALLLSRLRRIERTLHADTALP